MVCLVGLSAEQELSVTLEKLFLIVCKDTMTLYVHSAISVTVI